MSQEKRYQGFSRAAADPDPIRQFELWFAAARRAVPKLPEAMTLATSGAGGKPSARMVLLKSFDREGFVFYTNYQSRKAGDLETNPEAALLFYWPQLDRQVSIEGRVSRVDPSESDAYFATRPRGSQIGAHASHQSRPLESRRQLEELFQHFEKRFEGGPVPRPAHWGGYRLEPRRLEFWQGREDRLHDRLLYTREAPGRWRIQRLAP